ncbi:unnamed protein product [Gongylonema pulchrum]|uniref:PCI domain-containing protein n=1 Tax=Gongylonema pulchrum TaxID=637853 RepID=A0A183CVH6_9BILA|nr:unnamed protein product [Gongylonema pulchrum]
MGQTVRLYALVESSLKKITAQSIIDNIRMQILPFDRTYDDHPINDVGNDIQVRLVVDFTTYFATYIHINCNGFVYSFSGFLGETLVKIYKQCSQLHIGNNEEMPNVVVAVARGSVMIFGILGKAVIAILRKNPGFYGNPLDELKYSLLSNCTVPVAMIERSDQRFFIFTTATMKILLRALPSHSLFTCSHVAMTWALHIWQVSLYSKDPLEVTGVGFLLVEPLWKLISEGAIDVGQQLLERPGPKSDEQAAKEEKMWLQLLQKDGQQPKNPNFQKQQSENPDAQEEQSKNPSVQEQQKSNSEKVKQLKRVLSRGWRIYEKMLSTIEKMLRDERIEMTAHLNRAKQFKALLAIYSDVSWWGETIQRIEERQNTQLKQMRFFVIKVLNYQSLAQGDLLLNIDKLIRCVDRLGSEKDIEACTYRVSRCYENVKNVMVFLVKMSGDLTAQRKEMKEIAKLGRSAQTDVNLMMNLEGLGWVSNSPAR